MRNLKKLAVTAAASALLASLGLAVAQSSDDPMATPQQNVDVTAPNTSGQQIYFFRDQGNSPETDPAAHLMLIKHDQMMTPVAERTTTTTTTVAEASTPADTVTTTMPAAADTSNTESTDMVAAPMADQPALAPKADRN
jgi:hypothetical protein